ncbi:MAG: hypothetical protein ACOX3R_13535 [Desulfitobacteriia bacterium]
MKKTWLVSIIALVIFFGITYSMDVLMAYFGLYVQRTFSYFYLGVFLKTLILLIFGLFLGLFHFVQERKKVGFWEINKSKICFWGIPSFIVTLFVNIVYMGLQIPIILPSQSVYITNTRGFVFQFSAILLGFIIMTSFYKETEKTKETSLEVINQETISE